MRVHLAALGVAGALLLQPQIASAENLTADTILSGGKIVTLDSKAQLLKQLPFETEESSRLEARAMSRNCLGRGQRRSISRAAPSFRA